MCYTVLAMKKFRKYKKPETVQVTLSFGENNSISFTLPKYLGRSLQSVRKAIKARFHQPRLAEVILPKSDEVQIIKWRRA